MAAAEAEGRNLLLPVDDAEVRAAYLACCVSVHAQPCTRQQCLVQPRAYLCRATFERALLLCRTASGACTGCSATCSGLVRARPAVVQCLVMGLQAL